MARSPFMGAAGPTWWFVPEAKTAAWPQARAEEVVWLDETDVVEDDAPDEGEEPPTLPGFEPNRVPFAMADATTVAPRRRLDGLLLRATLLVGGVALLFVLGWWRDLASPRIPASTSATRTVLAKAPRRLDPPPEPPSLAQPAPGPFVAPAPRLAAPASRAASVYEPTDL